MKKNTIVNDNTRRNSVLHIITTVNPLLLYPVRKMVIATSGLQFDQLTGYLSLAN